MNSPSTLIDQVRQIAADVFGEELDAVTSETTPATVETWDSLATLNLALALEDAFHCEITPEDFDAMTSIAAVAALVADKTAHA